MRIHAINSFKRVNFKSQTKCKENEGNCYPHCPIHSSDYTPKELADAQAVEAVWQGHYRNSEELKETLVFLLQESTLKPDKNSSRINQVDIEILNSTDMIGIDCIDEELQGYKGTTPCTSSVEKNVRKMKEAGIKTVIDLVGYLKLKEACKEEKLDRFNQFKIHKIDYFFESPGFQSLEKYLENRKFEMKHHGISDDELNKAIEEEKEIHSINTRELIEDLKDFVDTINQGNFYISCEYGKDITNAMLAINDILNPEHNDLSSFFFFDFTSGNAILGLLDNLTAEDKQYFDITEEREAEIRERMDKAIEYDLTH